MLFIADPKRGTRRDVLLLHVFPTTIVFLAFLAVTIWAWQTTKARVNQQRDQAVAQETQRINTAIADRMDDYTQILRSANGLFEASDEVTRDEWRAFYNNYQIPQRYPGLQGIAFAERVPKDRLAAHQQRIRDEGYSNYTVTPAGDRAVYVPIVYPVATVTPENHQSVTGFGFDIASDQTRNQAITKAAETNEATLTGKLTLKISANQDQPAFILYQPVQGKGSTELAGFAYAPFTAKNLFEGIFRDDVEIGFAVYDQAVSPQNLLYKNELFNEASAPQEQTITIAGRDWVIAYSTPENIISEANRRNPTATLVAGIIFSTLIAGLVLSLLLGRTKSLAFAETRELQQAKDDLLSIASHQLRTPATGVKQYIGMLREGYAGKVPVKQKKLLDEAYASNERQLGIIDEILHVARIDTGRLVLQKERLKIRDIIDQILREQASAIKDKRQKILTTFPKRILYATGDAQYVRMAIENIISNAIKYTPEKGTLRIKIKRQGDFVSISVQDTGVGIAKKDLGQLFQKFSRIPNELSRQTAGSGVGLYIAKHLVELHGGTIDVESEAGVGTTFTILLPLALRRQQKD